MPEVASILISGYYGYANLGDEAILSVLLGELRAKFPDAVMRVISGSPEETSKAHKVESILWSDPLAIAQAVQASDLVVTGGGGIFHDYGGFPEDGLLTEGNWSLGFHVTAGTLANLFGKPHFIYGAGVGPLFSPHARRYMRAICDGATCVTVRDEGSRDLLLEIGCEAERIVVTADPVFLFDPAPAERAAEILEGEGIPPSEHRVLVVARPWTQVDSKQWETELARGLDLFCANEPGAQVILLPFQRFPGEQEDDLPVADRILELLEQTERAWVVRGHYSPAEQAALVAASQLTVGMRLHSLIFAIAARVPFVALTYDQKVTELIRRVGKTHLGLAIDDIQAAPLVERMRQALTEPVADPEPLRVAAGRSLAELDEHLRSGTTAPVLEESSYLIRTAVRSLLKSNHQLRFWLADQKINFEYQVRTGEARVAELENTAEELRQGLSKLQGEFNTLRLDNEQTRAALETESNLHQQHLEAAEALGVELKRQSDEMERLLRVQGSTLRSTQSDLQDTRQQLLDRETELGRTRQSLDELAERDRLTVADWEAYSEDLNRRLGVYRSQRAWRAMLALRKGYVVRKKSGIMGLLSWALSLISGNGQIETEQLEFPPRPRPRV